VYAFYVNSIPNNIFAFLLEKLCKGARKWFNNNLYLVVPKCVNTSLVILINGNYRNNQIVTIVIFRLSSVVELITQFFNYTFLKLGNSTIFL
jgi:hypothetical protein